ncbi:MAG: deoxyribodipyrimidine photo-lyase [Halofilum sp. (in: g-proteobacteria)]|nr:deoxyribodipyrimidine photo-lyase [Halofilum sp. (in: g-proteobacteria)]
MSTAIVWFRRDLRLSDNPALRDALGSFDRVLPVYVHAPEEEGEWAPGGAQRWWLHHSLQALAEDLAACGAPLVIRGGPTREALGRLLDETGAAAVLWNRLYEPALIERDRALKHWLREERGVIARSHNAALLFEPWEVATGQGEPYRVFTPFWRALERRGLPHRLQPRPRRLPGLARPPRGERVAELGLLPRVRWDAGLEQTWQPGEAGAQNRLDWFVEEALAAYDAGRDAPAEDGTSGLSPWLHCGEIGPRQVVVAVENAGLADTSDGRRFLAELGWREFAHHLLYHYPHTPGEPLDPKFAAFPWQRPGAELTAWQAGRTGIPLVDAGMRQLWHSGWMHNRVRMVVASLLTKNLRIHWREGARWFWDTLVDADLASNTLGWQWTAGCGADAAPFFRIFNPVRQGERFDPDGAYVRQWVPELAGLPDRHIHAPWQAPAEVLAAAGVRLGHDYPEPIVDLKGSRQRALDAFERMRRDARQA